MEVQLSTTAATPPPDENERYVALTDSEGGQRWLHLASDSDDVTEADFDFPAEADNA